MSINKNEKTTRQNYNNTDNKAKINKLHSDITTNSSNSNVLSETDNNMKHKGIVCLINLGCKVNKYEIDALGTILKNNGYETIYNLAYADIYVINTCAVTNESEKKSRQYISKLNKLNPNAKIIILGCASENDLEQFSSKQNVFSVIGNFGKQNILNLIETKIVKHYEHNTEFETLEIPENTKTRAYLKVQDGCNNFCSYCLIPYIRGRSRSRNLTDVITEANILALKAKEIVVTGIDLSSYKINKTLALDKLMLALATVNSYIRLGSLEVNVITQQFLNALKQMPNFREQFHLSMQSGSNGVLKRMNRHYTKQEYLEKIELIKNMFPRANITTDIIVGFPEETDEEFMETCDTIMKAKFGNIHIFPYSKRNGTVASKLKMVDGNIVKERETKLNRIKQMLLAEFTHKNLNKIETVLFEDIEIVNNCKYYVGYTGNYIKSYLPFEEDKLSGTIKKVIIFETFLDGALVKLKS